VVSNAGSCGGIEVVQPAAYDLFTRKSAIRAAMENARERGDIEEIEILRKQYDVFRRAGGGESLGP
jgi:hypothetical protein